MNLKGWISFSLLMGLVGGCGQKRSVHTTQYMESHYQISQGLYLSAKGEPLRVEKNTLSFYFGNEVTESLQRGCEKAFLTVAETAPLLFQKVNSEKSADITVHRGTVDDVTEHQASTRVVIINEIIDSAKITFDEQRIFSQTPKLGESDAESVCLHEIGHALGLAHSENEASVMYYALETGVRKRSFSAEDIENLKLLYGDENGKPAEINSSNSH